jgi:hypothetical protein
MSGGIRGVRRSKASSQSYPAPQDGTLSRFQPAPGVDAVHISRLCLANVSIRARFRTFGLSRWRTTRVAIVGVTGVAQDQPASIGDSRPKAAHGGRLVSLAFSEIGICDSQRYARRGLRRMWLDNLTSRPVLSDTIAYFRVIRRIDATWTRVSFSQNSSITLRSGRISGHAYPVTRRGYETVQVCCSTRHAMPCRLHG